MKQKSNAALSSWEHLAELRNYFFSTLGVFIAGAAVTHVYHVLLTKILFAPLGAQALVFLSPLDPLLFVFKIDFFGGFIIALPVLLFCLFRFIAPVFGGQSNLFVAVLLILSVLLALIASIYTYLLLLPLSIQFLLSIQVPGVTNLFTAQEYINFALMQLAMMAAIFQIPCVILALVFAKLLDPRVLAKKRPIVYTAAIVILSILTPTTDLYSLSLFLIPTLVIFEVSLLLGRAVYLIRHKH